MSKLKINRGLLSDCRQYKSKLTKDKYFIYKSNLRLLSRMNEILCNSYVTQRLNFICTLTDFKALLNGYYLGPRFNSYLLKSSLLSLFIARLPISFIKDDANFIETVISYLSVRIEYLNLFFQCHLITLKILFNSFRTEAISGHIVYFVDLKKNNTIDTNIDSYLNFCMNDEDINPMGSKTCFSNGYSNQSEICYKDITKGDFLDIVALPYFLWRFLLLDLTFFINFFTNKNYINLMYKENYKKIIVDSSLSGKSFSLVFSNSQLGLTPIWSKGDRRENFVLFYSTNFGYNYDEVQKKFLYPIEWSLMSWDNVYVWDEVQREVIKSYCEHVKFKIINKVNFVDSGINFHFDNSRFSLIIFDVSPRRLTMLTKSHNLGDLFYTELYMKKFVLDIVSACEHKNINIYLKKKRKISSESRSYSALIEKLVAENRVYLIEESISPERIIESADFVISPAYSTTSLIASLINIESVYYDPFGLIDDKLPYSRDVDVIKNKTDLEVKLNYAYEGWHA